MKRRIDNNTANISILSADYEKLCEDVWNKPEARALYWADHTEK
jgi:hypothetical protein